MAGFLVVFVPGGGTLQKRENLKLEKRENLKLVPPQKRWLGGLSCRFRELAEYASLFRPASYEFGASIRPCETRNAAYSEWWQDGAPERMKPENSYVIVGVYDPQTRPGSDQPAGGQLPVDRLVDYHDVQVRSSPCRRQVQC
jgi:hypothetical protein